MKTFKIYIGMFTTILLLTGIICGIFIESTVPELFKYENYSLYRIHPQNIDQLNWIRNEEETTKGVCLLNNPSSLLKPILLLVPPEYQAEFAENLKLKAFQNEVLDSNFQESLDREQNELNLKSGEYDWRTYHTLNETYSWLESLVTKYPNRVEIVVGGRTFEGREIRGVKVSFKSNSKAIFLEAGIHSNEWISPATVTYILNEILSNTDSKIRALVEKFDWYVFPHYNPDGFVYTHTTDRLWRKTRSKGSKCDGADPNRNWGFRWMEAGASMEECSNMFGGSREFSEIETRTLSEFLLTLKGTIHTYVAFHSYAQVLVHPYAAIKDQVANYEDLEKIGKATINELGKRYGTEYKIGSVYDVIYPAAGSSPDWVYAVLGVPVVFTYELRPQSSFNGFVLPSVQILPTGRETFDSLIAMISEAEKLGYYN